MLSFWQGVCYDIFMNVVGIIAEYNPFHNGHLYHLQKSREKARADFVIAVMSGNFTQRGEPAVLDKWTRSRLAVQCGVDLVLELPFAYAVNSAEYFAKGGVGILAGLGCVTHISFGAETENLSKLEEAAAFLREEKQEYRQRLKGALGKGISYAAAREQMLAEYLGEETAQLCRTPNNILALEYLKQLNTQKTAIKPIMVNRKGAGYYDQTPKENIASASAIRNTLTLKQRRDCVPENVETALEQGPEISGYFNLVRTAVLCKDTAALSAVFSVSEGLENRLKDQVRRCNNLSQLVESVSTKRYPQSRISRILCQAAVGLTDFDDSFYARILAAGEKGTVLLKHLKKTAEIPIITNINKVTAQPALLHYDILAADLYNLLIKSNLYENCDHVKAPYIQSVKRDKLLENRGKEDYNR